MYNYVYSSLRRKALLLAGLIGILLLAGCGLAPADSLLSLPKVPAEYVQLQKQLDEILAGGATYAVAETGTNRQAVQLVDMDADGEDEALAFFQTPDGTYQVYVFRQEGEQYSRIGMAEGFGSTLRSIYYPVCGTEGQLALALCWGFDQPGSYGMTVYDFGLTGMKMLLDIQYSDVAISDITGDGVAELAFGVRDSATGLFSVRTLQFQAGQYRTLFESPLCLEVKNVVNMVFSALPDGSAALFVDSSATTGGYVTDLIVYDGKLASNRTIDPSSGSGSATWRFAAATCTDVDGDGVPEIPVAHAFQRETNEIEAHYRIDWVNMLSPQPEVVSGAFYQPGENWYFTWPHGWGDEVRVDKGHLAYAEQTVFYWEDEDDRTVLLNIWVFSDSSGNGTAGAARRYKSLGATANGLYYFAIPDAEDSIPYLIAEDDVREAFHTIEASWRTEEY